MIKSSAEFLLNSITDLIDKRVPPDAQTALQCPRPIRPPVIRPLQVGDPNRHLLRLGQPARLLPSWVEARPRPPHLGRQEPAWSPRAPCVRSPRTLWP